jgi:hypothetical protein
MVKRRAKNSHIYAKSFLHGFLYVPISILKPAVRQTATPLKSCDEIEKFALVF